MCIDDGGESMVMAVGLRLKDGDCGRKRRKR